MIQNEIDAISEELTAESKRLQREHGISDELLESIEAARRPKGESAFWAHQIQDTPVTISLDSLVGPGLEKLLATVKPQWLDREAAGQFRLPYGDNLDRSRLHLVGKVRLLPDNSPPRPHRFAEMLLIAKDFLDHRPDLDIFAGATLVGEVATLGRSIDLIQDLGTEAVSKFSKLADTTPREIAPTIYELLVGIACVRSSLTVEMLARAPQGNSPDFRVHDRAVPIVIECKRRDGLSDYSKKKVVRLSGSSRPQITCLSAIIYASRRRFKPRFPTFRMPTS